MKLRNILLLSFCLFAYTLYARNAKNNIVYQDNNVRFTLITPGVIRMEYTSNGSFVDNSSFIAVNRSYSEVKSKVNKRKEWLEINTSKMTLRYKLNSGRFTPENLEIISLVGTLN